MSAPRSRRFLVVGIVAALLLLGALAAFLALRPQPEPGLPGAQGAASAASGPERAALTVTLVSPAAGEWPSTIWAIRSCH